MEERYNQPADPPALDIGRLSAETLARSLNESLWGNNITRWRPYVDCGGVVFVEGKKFTSTSNGNS